MSSTAAEPRMHVPTCCVRAVCSHVFPRHLGKHDHKLERRATVELECLVRLSSLPGDICQNRLRPTIIKSMSPRYRL